MPVTDVTTDLENRTLVFTADFAAPVDRVWDVYADARKLERVWGPPEYPATFPQHDLAPGARSHYFMTSPEGDKFAGYWDIDSVDDQKSFAFRDGFAQDAETFAPNTDLPESVNVFAFESTDSGTRATYTGTYATAEALEQVLAMGMVEGFTAATAQIDALLAS